MHSIVTSICAKDKIPCLPKFIQLTLLTYLKASRSPNFRTAEKPGIWQYTYITQQLVLHLEHCFILFYFFNAINFFFPVTSSSSKGCRYKALYPFEARNQDELSLTPEDIVWVRGIQFLKIQMLFKYEGIQLESR